MEDYLDGSPRAFAELYAALEPRVRARIRKLVGAHGPVDDLVQITFLLAHRSRHGWILPPGADDRSVIAWFCTIARNAATTDLRKRGARPEGSEHAGEPISVDAQPCPAPDPEVELDRERTAADHREALREALQRLTPPQRAVMELLLTGKPMHEIADALGIKPVAARVRAHRARLALRACWPREHGLDLEL